MLNFRIEQYIGKEIWGPKKNFYISKKSKDFFLFFLCIILQCHIYPFFVSFFPFFSDKTNLSFFLPIFHFEQTFLYKKYFYFVISFSIISKCPKLRYNVIFCYFLPYKGIKNWEICHWVHWKSWFFKKKFRISNELLIRSACEVFLT